MSLLTPIGQLPGVRSDFAQKFRQLGLVTLRDALLHFPFRHEDWRRRATIDQVTAGQDVTLLVKVARLSGRRGWRKKVSVTEARVTDDGRRSFYVIWYNQPYLVKTLRVGDWIFVSGTVDDRGGKLQMINPAWERPSDDPLHAKLVPVYRSVEGLSQRQIRRVIKQAVALAPMIPETLPTNVLTTYNLQLKSASLEQIHFPDSPEQAAAAVRRLKFDELLAWQLAWQRDQGSFRQQTAAPFPFQEVPVRAFVQSLPFQLTTDQRVAAWQILQDLARDRPMSRLLQGDVGSGKTVVAAIAAYNVVRQSAQVALLAPTVLLAEQHYRTFVTMLEPHQVRIALLTGKQARMNDTKSLPDKVAAGLRRGDIDIIIGTHALIQGSLAMARLGLVIVDEQQRFGVEQRDALLQSAVISQAPTPHFLSLTATPIPRTLALFIAGELDITTIRHKPADRQKIITEVVMPANRRRLAEALHQTVSAKHQVFVITPLIEESDSLGARAAATEFERLRTNFPAVRFGLVHGALPPADRLRVLERFRHHQLDALVGTTVLEVGLDVPNATLMIIEGAERFGLAQLHQLRGRVGRSHLSSRCLLATDQDSQVVRQRLQQVADIDDGFKLSELDLQERGGGELYGLRQSGLPDWQLATLADSELLVLAKQVAQELLVSQPPGIITRLSSHTGPSGVRHRE